VLNSVGKLLVESIIDTKAATILQFMAGLRGSLHVTFEEGTWATWLYDLLKPHVTNLVVCNPRKNALLKEGNKSDKMPSEPLVGDTPKEPLHEISLKSTGLAKSSGLCETVFCQNVTCGSSKGNPDTIGVCEACL
jgi:hypothetical protein